MRVVGFVVVFVVFFLFFFRGLVVAGCQGMLAALQFCRAELSVIVPQMGTWSTVAATMAAKLGGGSFGVTLGQHAVEEPEVRNSQ